MRRFVWIAVLWMLLPFACASALEVAFSNDAPALGETVEVYVTGAEGQLCQYTLKLNEKTIFEGEAVPCHEGILHPREKGQYTLLVACGDETAQGTFRVGGEGAAMPGVITEKEPLQVLQGGREISGRRENVFSGGDVRAWQVFSSQPWFVSAEGDFITLNADCGISGDLLTVTVSPEGEDVRGKVVFISGDEKTEIVLEKSSRFTPAEEEELSFEETNDFILADGAAMTACFLSGSDKTVEVIASGEWDARCDADFITFEKTDDGLFLYADENETDAVRQGTVVLSCGSKYAYVKVLQPPAEEGAGVTGLRMNMETATAWQDKVLALAETDLSAVTLSVTAGGKTDVFDAKTYAMAGEDSLLWQVEIPAREAGEYALLFAAEDENGRSSLKKTARIRVEAEKAELMAGSVQFTAVGSRRTLSFVTTAAAEEAAVLDENGALLMNLSRADALCRYGGEGEEKERYVLWEAALEDGAVPGFVEVGKSREKAAVRSVLTPWDITLFSQTDGWWRTKKYSISELETSGCAVFSLSHALQLLGYAGEEVLPENLAKTYSVALMKDGSGTMNSTLVGRAGNDFGFKTQYELIKDRERIRKKADEGTVFTFSVVSGHIACVAGVEEEGQMCLIIDSAPSATFERKGNTKVWYRGEDGLFKEAATPADLPGIRYCIETNSYGCAVYYLEMDYVAKRGVRLIQPR